MFIFYAFEKRYCSIVDIEKCDGICSPAFAVDEFSGLHLHPSVSFLLNIQDLHKK